MTCIDSSDPWLTDIQQAAQWQRRGGIVYSQRLTTTDELFYQRDGQSTPGYDEWYLFDTAKDLGELITRDKNPFDLEHSPRPRRLMIFVNFGAFVLHETGEAERTLIDMFWRQLEWVRPVSYIGDGNDCLTFVSRDAALFDIVLDRLSTALLV